jgi:transposase
VKLGKFATKTLEMLREAFGEHFLSRRAISDWHSRFKAGRVSVEDHERSGRPSTCETTENVEKIRDLIQEDRRRTIHELADIVGISYGVCQEILTENLNMRRIAAKFVP